MNGLGGCNAKWNHQRADWWLPGAGAGAGVGVKQVKGAEAQTSSASQDIMSSTVATVSNATLCMLSLYKSSS